MDPRILIVRVTEGCNAGCFMCSFAHLPVTYSWSLDEAKQLVSNAQEAGIRLVRFTGGEPLLLSQTGELIQLLSKAGMLTSIITNGWFLEERAAVLVDAGLDQVIISLDGSNSKSHDKFRRTAGLFERILAGAKAIKKLKPEIVLRVNSVIGIHNIHELEQIYGILQNMQVDQWSIIPLKRPDGIWEYPDRRKFLAEYESAVEFLEGVSEEGSIRLMGYSSHFAGRSPAEIDDFLDEQTSMRPSGNCELVRSVRYYTPQDGKMTVCNCVPHRENAPTLRIVGQESGFSSTELAEEEEWYYQNGPSTCKGCEPINASFGDGNVDLELDPFGL